MKKILLFIVFITSLGFASKAQADEYQCVIRSTRAAHCEPYYDIEHRCPFPEALNEKRTQEVANGKPTYPDFCATCGTESKIPKNCQSGRITTYVSTNDTDATTASSETSVTPAINPQDNTIMQNAYLGFKITVKKAWEWLKVALKGESFELKNPTTPVAGVRG